MGRIADDLKAAHRRSILGTDAILPQSFTEETSYLALPLEPEARSRAIRAKLQTTGRESSWILR